MNLRNYKFDTFTAIIGFAHFKLCAAHAPKDICVKFLELYLTNSNVMKTRGMCLDNYKNK